MSIIKHVTRDAQGPQVTVTTTLYKPQVNDYLPILLQGTKERELSECRQTGSLLCTAPEVGQQSMGSPTITRVSHNTRAKVA